MSLKRLAVIAAVSTHNSFSNQTVSYYNAYTNQTTTTNSIRGSSGHNHQGLQSMRPGANLHGNVNIMLGGAMLSVVITVVCFVCYCCHRNIKKRSNSIYRQQWLENEANMEIYSVEQCYDTPASSAAGSSNLFLDNTTGNEYQSLPAMTYGHHHHHHYHHPHGPPPSYDTVLAQDEMVGTTRRKSFDLGALPPEGDANSRGPAAKFDALLYDLVGNQRRKRNRPVGPEFCDFSGILRSPGCGEIATTTTTTTAATAHGNCNCQLSDNLQVYCRNCGQFVDGEVMQNHGINNNNNHYYDNISNCNTEGDDANWLRVVTIGADNLLGCNGSSDDNGNNQSANNEGICRRDNCQIRSLGLNALLQDFQFHSVGATSATGSNSNELYSSSDCINNNNNNNNIDESDCTGANHKSGDDDTDEVNNNNKSPSVATAPEPVRSRTILNSGTTDITDNAIGGGDSNNANSPTGGNDLTVGVDSSVNAASAAGANHRASDNGNGGAGREHDTFRNLAENGFVRLDMSQIIDRTGLPTYEAALRLESSGYV
ncbi:uncharacterized protein LOC131693689 [Topomyia yanbarensis]|uniref:uncharacterized protein LOC131693689 n=1 Tax=Topomyia yanbarensis TaxID=2498891 RepID=UPI00273C8D77|nr:uncharacterized protein LOC131693689 [Topomyia yanbarensis]